MRPYRTRNELKSNIPRHFLKNKLGFLTTSLFSMELSLCPCWEVLSLPLLSCQSPKSLFLYMHRETALSPFTLTMLTFAYIPNSLSHLLKKKKNGVQLLYNVVSFCCLYTYITFLLDLPCPHPTLQVSHHRALRRSAYATQHLPTSYLFYTSFYIYVNASLPFPHCVPLSILYTCISISALQIGSSVPSFQIPYTCINIQYLFFSF